MIRTKRRYEPVPNGGFQWRSDPYTRQSDNWRVPPFQASITVPSKHQCSHHVRIIAIEARFDSATTGCCSVPVELLIVAAVLEFPIARNRCKACRQTTNKDVFQEHSIPLSLTWLLLSILWFWDNAQSWQGISRMLLQLPTM